MIHYFNTTSLREATHLYKDLVKSLSNNPGRLKEASEQFAGLTHPAYQQLVLRLAGVEGITFNCHGLILTVIRFSYNYRKQLGRIRVPGYLTRFNEEKGQWSYIPFNKVRLSQEVVMNLLKGVEGIEVRKSGSWLWIAGDTFKVRGQIKAAVKGTFLKVGFQKQKKEWYACPKH